MTIDDEDAVSFGRQYGLLLVVFNSKVSCLDGEGHRRETMNICLVDGQKRELENFFM